MDNSNEAHDLPREVKNNIKRMATEQGLYAQVVNICRKGLKCFATDKNRNEAKIKFQRQYARSQQWFYFDLECIDCS